MQQDTRCHCRQHQQETQTSLMGITRGFLYQSRSTHRISGQSTIEFLATFTFSLLFIILFLKMALNFTNSYLIQYATFQASRAYLVYDTGLAVEQDVNFSKRIFDNYANLISSGFKTPPTFNVKIPAAGDDKTLYTGAYSSYTDIFSFSDTLGGKKDITFKSEAFLGKEPRRTVCKANICSIGMTGTLLQFCTGRLYVTHYDNGC